MEPLTEKSIFDIYLKLFLKNTEAKKSEGFEVVVLGFKNNDFIMTTYPENRKKDFNASVGSEYEVSYLFNGKSYDFQTKILRVYDDLSPLIFFSYPKDFKEKSIRKGERVRVFIPLTIRKILLRDGTSREINDPKNKILDISRGGCLISTSRELELGSILILDFFLPNGDHIHNLHICVRNSRRTAIGTYVGAEFQNMRKEDSKKFDEFFSRIE